MSDDDKDQDQKPAPPKRPAPDPNLRDLRNLEDKPPRIILEESDSGGDE